MLEIRRLRMPRLYDLTWEKPPTLVERYLRLVVNERIDARARCSRPLDPPTSSARSTRCWGEGIEALAVCLLNAYANPVHEERDQDAVQRRRRPG